MSEVKTRLLTLNEASEMLAMTPSALYQRANKGMIPYVKMGPAKQSPVRFRLEDVEAFIEKSTVYAFDKRGGVV